MKKNLKEYYSVCKERDTEEYKIIKELYYPKSITNLIVLRSGFHTWKEAANYLLEFRKRQKESKNHKRK